MLASLTSLVSMCKIQNKFYSKMRLVALLKIHIHRKRIINQLPYFYEKGLLILYDKKKEHLKQNVLLPSFEFHSYLFHCQMTFCVRKNQIKIHKLYMYDMYTHY